MFVSKQKIVTCRKPHRCTWCGQQIETGESCVTWGNVDGKFWVENRMHVECNAVAEYDPVDGLYMTYENERPVAPAKSTE